MPTNPKLPLLEGLISPPERQAILQARPTAPIHPLAALLIGESPQTRLIAANTERALGRVRGHDAPWIDTQRKRLLQTDTLTEPASALAELRAYGALLEAGLSVAATPTTSTRAQPDFKVRFGNEEMRVEVHAKQHDESMATEIELFHRTDVAEGATQSTSQPPSRVTIRTLAVQPFGRPRPGKPDDTVQTTAISKVSQIKDDEAQFTEGIPALLWLDLQDAHNLSMALSVEDCSPMASWRGSLSSGVLWYALYGWRGAPVFEHHCPLLPFEGRGLRPMAHDGRFRRSARLSAVLISFPHATVLSESFRAAARLPQTFQRHFSLLPYAHLPSSIINWCPDQVKDTIALQARMICAIAGHSYSPPQEAGCGACR
jgi:hypothetical protein